MKFIHTADIHLDSPLSGLAQYQAVVDDDEHPSVGSFSEGASE